MSKFWKHMLHVPLVEKEADGGLQALQAASWLYRGGLRQAGLLKD